jgi:non-specific serine/threonine protein kinase
MISHVPDRASWACLADARFSSCLHKKRVASMRTSARFGVQMIGNTVSHYRIGQQLGRGGMGVVYQAEDIRLGRSVALKFLSEAQLGDRSALERLRREARAASALNHPHICAVHDIGEYQGLPFIVMEFLDGEPLSARLAGRQQEVPEILKVARQVASALAASHEKQIVHRDIKPSNIMISARGDVKVLDFGLAKTIGKPQSEVSTAITMEGSVLGTVQYMSPEQALGRPVDQRTDIFSLGVLLYEMATGRLPFSGPTMMETLNHIINTEPEAISRLNVNIPPGLERVISRCLEKDIRYRFQNANELLEDLGKPDPDTPRQNRRGIRNNLPQQLSRFIGRQNEVAEIGRLLTETRLLTLAGSGGMGKTRLALEVAAGLLSSYDDGVWFIELASLSDEALVPQTVATALGLREERKRSVSETLEGYLKQRRVLLILDNCEHVVGACARLTEGLLRACPNLRILATSREVLTITGETVFRVPSLDEAVDLFIDRARSVQPAFEPTSENAPLLTSICARLEGIPLAIELAASRVKAMSVEQIRARLADRMTLLTGGSRTAMPRQQTLRGAIDWSYNLLSEDEQVLFRRLSVFAGGWALDAAESVCSGDGVASADVLELLSALVDKSLVSVEQNGPRYRLMSTLLEYAHSQLDQSGELDRIRKRYAGFYLDLAEEGDRNIFGSQQKVWLERLTAELDNFRTVLGWASTSDPRIGLRMAGALGQFWHLRGHFVEGRNWVQHFLPLEDGGHDKEHIAKALVSAGRFAWMQGDYGPARSYCERALELFRESNNKVGVSGALASLGNIARLTGDTAAEQKFHHESLAISKEIGHKRGIAVSLNNLGIAADLVGDYTAARSFLEESLAISMETGDDRGTAMSLDNLANLAHRRGDFPTALSLHERSLALRRELGDKHGTAATLNNLGEAIWHVGDFERAQSIFDEALEIRRELGDRSGIAMSLNNMSEIARRKGEYARAVPLAKESLELFREMGYKHGVGTAQCNLAEISALQGDLAGANSLYRESLVLLREVGDKLGVGTVLCGMGAIAHRQADFAEAALRFRESLAVFRDLNAPAEELTAMERLAAVDWDRGQADRAVVLWSACQTLRELLSFKRSGPDIAEYDARVRVAGERMSELAFRDAWNKGAALSLQDAVALALH